MTKLRYITTAIIGLLLPVIGFVAAAPAAFAMRAVRAPDDSRSATLTYILTQAGLAGRQVALLALGQPWPPWPSPPLWSASGSGATLNP